MQYDAPATASDVNASLANNATLSQATRQQIEEILGTASGGTSNTVEVAYFDGTNLQAPSNGSPVDLMIVAPALPSNPQDFVPITIPTAVLQSAQAYLFQTDANIEVTFNTVERVIASGNGSDKITVNGDKNTTLDGGNGNDTLTTSGGNDSITGGAGNDSISSGAGNDTIISGIGNDTIDGGSGRDVAVFNGDKSNYAVSLVNGQLIISDKSNSANKSQISNVEFVEFSNGSSLAVASNADEAATLRLYQGILGRDADKTGADYWVNVLASDATSKVGIANAFLLSSELGAQGSLSNEQFVDALYTNTLGRSADQAGKAYWLNDLANGQERANVAINIVGSAEAETIIDSVIVISN